MLNTLSSVSVRESRIQYLCDPQWFRDTASRGPTTIAAPESQFQTCPTDHAAAGDQRSSPPVGIKSSVVGPILRGTRSQIRPNNNYWDRVSGGVHELCHSSRRLSHSRNTNPVSDLSPRDLDCGNCSSKVKVIQVSQLVVEMAQLVVSREMPPRRRGRATRQIPAEYEGHNEEIQRSAPVHRRARQVDDEVDVLEARVDEMELIMARFQRMNPQNFDGDESSSDAESCCSILPDWSFRWVISKSFFPCSAAEGGGSSAYAVPTAWSFAIWTVFPAPVLRTSACPGEYHD
ncbi:hypothetical protein F511_37429 [Dorcoceras hygrometricum]|uniref:Uncharacterized protein n=1 Tax=Dorcoceras hygrometricum TaxID=472368 RepID=A0A2Z7AAL9_9LAMI|nr:hypothetical protein F511_37429 [Dorcoceras hygrometricum]